MDAPTPTRRKRFLALLVIALLASSALTHWWYYYSIHWLTDNAFYAVDDTWKILLGIYIGLSRRSLLTRLAILVIGVAAIWVMSNFWLIIDLQVFEAVQNPYHLFDTLIWRSALTPTLVATTICAMNREQLFLKREIDCLRFGIRHVMVLVLTVAVALSVIKARVNLAGDLFGLYTSVAIALRSTLCAVAAFWAVFAARGWMIPLASVLCFSFVVTLTIPWLFDRQDLFADWTVAAIFRSVVLIASLLLVHRSGYWRPESREEHLVFQEIKGDSHQIWRY